MTHDNPFFSIIIPTYNSENTLGRCLDSIIGQGFSNFEIIIVDGLSSDRTVEVARKKNDPRIRILSEKDQGVYDAMNKGIDLALGNWLLFLGSDDRLIDGTVLKDTHEYLVKTQAEMVYGDIQVFGDAGFAKDGAIYDGEFSLSKLFLKNICHQSIFYSQGIFSKVGYYNITYFVAADWDLNLRCFARGRVRYFNRVITLFSGGGISSQMRDGFVTLRERGLKIKTYFGYSLLNRQFGTVSGDFLSEAYALYTQKKPLEAFRYLALYLYHTKNKTRVLGRLAVRSFSKAYYYSRKGIFVKKRPE